MDSKKYSHARDYLAVEVCHAFVPLEKSDYVLFVEDYSHTFALHHTNSTIWLTRFYDDIPAMPWPPQGKIYDVIFVRLQKSHERFDFLLRALQTVSHTTTKVYVYGFNDEGIKGAKKKMSDFYGNSMTIGFKKHCRVIMSLSKNTQKKQLLLTNFIYKKEISYENTLYPISYLPGMFAAGTLDAGTKLLLDATITRLSQQSRILDFACGSGIIAKILHSYHKVDFDLLDNDTLSLEMAKKNCADFGKDYYLSDTIQITQEYNLIISNPPMHTEKDEHTTIIEDLIRTAPKYLLSHGELIIVVQSRLKLDSLFAQAFSSYSIITETPQYKIWQGLK